MAMFSLPGIADWSHLKIAGVHGTAKGAVLEILALQNAGLDDQVCENVAVW